MYKKQASLLKWGYMINNKGNAAENEKKAHKDNINRPRARHGHKYTKYKMCICVMIVICIKQHPSNI